MRKVINLILNNFTFFLFLISILLLNNKILIFKLANNNISDTYILAFENYLKHKKITFFTKKIKKVNKSVLFSGLKQKEKIKRFDEKLFYQYLKNYKSFLNWVYKILGFSLLFLIYKFFKKVRF